MRGSRMGSYVLVGSCLLGEAVGQQEMETCYGAGSVVGAVAGTLIVTVGLLACGFYLYKMYWKSRKGNHLVFIADAENPHDQYAFDNPCFREATPIKHIQDHKQTSKLDKIKWPGWPPIHSFGKSRSPDRITSMDDSYLNDSRLKVVTLKGHDFTGLGFNICGNMRDGILVKDVLHRGPAFESGCINTGDRIDSVCISFRNMVFEDALTILSYASPYDVQVHLENDSCSRPSTLMRSKRESNTVNCSDRILHPKFARSQSVSQLNEIGNSNNKKLSHQMGLMLEKNRVNHSLSKSQDFGDYPTIKVSSPGNKVKAHKASPLPPNTADPQPHRDHDSHQTKSSDSTNKLHKFGIKVLPMSISPKTTVQSVPGAKNPAPDTSPANEKPEKPAKPKELSRNPSSLTGDNTPSLEEPDTGKDNVKAMLTKGLFNLKEKINQNSLGRKRRAGEEGSQEEGETGGECPVPRRRSSATSGAKGLEERQERDMNVPEEVFRAGDVARSNRKSVVEGRGLGGDMEGEGGWESEGSSDRESGKDETKRRKRSKGKAPSPPKGVATSKEMNEIKRESEVMKEETSIFEPEAKIIPLKDEEDVEENRNAGYDSDSDAEPISRPKNSPGTKIELNATQVTVHHSPTGDTNDEEVEPSRKAASLGDLSRLDSDQPLSIVLERAVSLDLTEGTSQSGKKRKAPLPPSEEFPGAFDDMSYRKEPRLEGLNTFQRRLKKSSDFGTLEDALCDEPKSLDIEVNKLPDPTEAHSYNIQEFSEWLAECRRPKSAQAEAATTAQDNPKPTSTSLVNINSETDNNPEDNYEFQGGNVSFRINGNNFPHFDASPPKDDLPLPTPTSRTVLVISQPNSLDPVPHDAPDEPPNGSDDHGDPHLTSDPKPPSLPASPASPASPAPSSNTLSSPLSSPLTYVTEIKVSTSEQPTTTPELSSVAERIHRFDSLTGVDAPLTKALTEPSKIPIRTMKSETGQRVLATIQSLAKESSGKTPEAEYAKRVASLFSTSSKGDRSDEADIRPNVSGLYLSTTPPKPSKDYSPSKKIPPVVPPRKIETSLATRSTVTVGPPTPPSDAQERNIVTFSSFAGRNRTEDPKTPSKISLSVKQQPEINGGQQGVVPVRASATNIVVDGQEKKDGL